MLIWSTLLMIWALTNQSIRDGLPALIRTAFTKPLTTVYATMALYVIVVVYGMNWAGLWEVSQLKPTMIWAFSIALLSTLRAHKITDDPDYFKRAVRDNINLVVVLEFILGFYTFPLAGELVLVPVITVLGAVKVFAEKKEEYRPAEKFLDGLFVVFGIFVVGNAVFKLWIGFDAFASMQTLRDFYTPPLLSFLFLPFLFALSVFLAYERVFRKLKNHSRDEATYRYARSQAVRNFLLGPRQLERWANTTFLNRLTSKDAVNESIADFKALVADEANPEDVPSHQGWSPQLAKNFLAEYGLKTGYYNRMYDDKWSASSDYLELDDGILPNSIAYYVYGNRSAAKSLKLRLNVNETNTGEAAVERFAELAEALLGKALSGEISTNLGELIRGGQSAETQIAGKFVSVGRKDWRAAKTGQYDVSLEVSMSPVEETSPESGIGE